MAVRSSDMDPIGHVNNAVYLDYLETAVERRFGGGQKIKEVWIQFHREISRQTSRVQVGIGRGQNRDRHDFTIMSEGCIHAFGDLAVTGVGSKN